MFVSDINGLPASSYAVCTKNENVHEFLKKCKLAFLYVGSKGDVDKSVN